MRRLRPGIWCDSIWYFVTVYCFSFSVLSFCTSADFFFPLIWSLPHQWFLWFPLTESLSTLPRHQTLVNSKKEETNKLAWKESSGTKGRASTFKTKIRTPFKELWMKTPSPCFLQRFVDFNHFSSGLQYSSLWTTQRSVTFSTLYFTIN